MLRVGAIGYRNHAKRIIDQVDASGLGRVTAIHHPTKGDAIPLGTTRLEDLFACDAILVLSPTDTHHEYLRALAQDFRGYIFCEKPPVSRLSQLAGIRIPGGRVYFNFNQRFGLLHHAAAAAMGDGTLGRPLSASMTIGHGLAFKEGYAGSWRADARRHPGGVAETLAIHYVDLLVSLLGEPCRWSKRSWNIAATGDADDTCHLALEFADGAVGTVFASYAMPAATEFRVIGTNGILEFTGDRLTLRGPRDSLDATGCFVPPPLIREQIMDWQTVYRDSLEKSVVYFLSQVQAGMPFPDRLFQQAMIVSRMVLAT